MGGDAIHLHSPVTSILQDDDLVIVKAEPHGLPALRVRARRVLFSGSPQTSSRVAFTPPLPYEKLQLFQRMPMGNALKAQLVYSMPFWRDEGKSGLITNLVELDTMPATCMDDSPLDSNYGVLLCFVQGILGDKLSVLPKARRRDYIAAY